MKLLKPCLQVLRNAGVKLALDDFGTGYSSLGYLHRLPIDCVQDRPQFRCGIKDPIASGVVTSIVNLCRSMKMQCVVEGVEESNQLELLEAMHCRWSRDTISVLPCLSRTFLPMPGKTEGLQGFPCPVPPEPAAFSSFAPDRQSGTIPPDLF